MRRVVVTGIGLVTPLGVGTDHNWRRLLAGESGLRAIQSFDVSDLPAKIAGQVPRGSTAEGFFNTDDWVPSKDQKKMDLFIVYAIGAAVQAVEDSGWQPQDDEARTRSAMRRASSRSRMPTSWCAAAPRRRSAGSAWLASRRRGRSRPISTTSRGAPRGRGI